MSNELIPDLKGLTFETVKDLLEKLVRKHSGKALARLIGKKLGWIGAAWAVSSLAGCIVDGNRKCNRAFDNEMCVCRTKGGSTAENKCHKCVRDEYNNGDSSSASESDSRYPPIDPQPPGDPFPEAKSTGPRLLL